MKSTLDPEKAFDETVRSIQSLPPQWFENLDFSYERVIISLTSVVLELLKIPEIKTHTDEPRLLEKMSKFCHQYLCDPEFAIDVMRYRQDVKTNLPKLGKVFIQTDGFEILRSQLNDALLVSLHKNHKDVQTPQGWEYPRTQKWEKKEKKIAKFCSNPSVETWEELPVPITLKNLSFPRGFIFYHKLKKYEDTHLSHVRKLKKYEDTHLSHVRKLFLLKQYYVLKDAIVTFQSNLLQQLGDKDPADVVNIENVFFQTHSSLRNFVWTFTHSPVEHFVRGAILCRYILLLLRLVETKQEKFKVFVASYALEALDQLLGYCDGTGDDKSLGFPTLNTDFWSEKRRAIDPLVPGLDFKVASTQDLQKLSKNLSFTKQISSFQNAENVEVDINEDWDL